MQNLYREDLDNNFKYAWQYQEAYEILVKKHQGGSHLSMPILFTLRHYLELILKANIEYLSFFSNSNLMLDKLDNEHRLVQLSNAFLEHYNLAKNETRNTIEDDLWIKDFMILKDLFIELDNRSYTFRYPYDKNGNISLPVESKYIGTRINIVYEKATIFLDSMCEIFPKEDNFTRNDF